jgi:uncharacterized protein (DUF983 family)
MRLSDTQMFLRSLSMSSSPDARKRKSLPALVFRGLRRRCAWCGSKKAFFVTYFKKVDRCQSCGVKWERNLEGFELGAATMGVFMTFGSIILWMVISVIVGVDLVPLLVIAGVLAVAVPLVTYPLTYTVWFGIHLFMNEFTDEELHDAEIWRLEHSVQG